MPWFPDFVSAAELARAQTRSDGRADPVGRYLAAPAGGDARELEAVWPGDVVVHDPRAGEVRGHRQLKDFVRRNQAWLATRHARVDTTATTCVGGRAVVELVAHLADGGGAWPVAAAEPGDVVGRLQRALTAGDTEAAVGTFAPGGYLRGPLGVAEPRSYATAGGDRRLRARGGRPAGRRTDL